MINAPNLTDLRNEIDKLDHLLVDTLLKRQAILKQIAEFKRGQNLPSYDPKRLEEILSTRRRWAEQLELDPEFVTEVFQAIHRWSLKIQNENAKS